MAHGKFDNVELTLLKALRHNDRATISEVSAMLPAEGKDRLEAAKAKLEAAKLVEPVPGSTTGQMQLTSAGAEAANDLTDDMASGSGGGKSAFQ